jgi:S-adenosylmethionine:diacylglycerol 3-amino-3-carboxypropyl transferase
MFGRMHEDWRVEAEVFRPGGRIFCIASSGYTALALAERGFRVTAVDVNPAQIARRRARGRPRAAQLRRAARRRRGRVGNARPLAALGSDHGP